MQTCLRGRTACFFWAKAHASVGIKPEIAGKNTRKPKQNNPICRQNYRNSKENKVQKWEFFELSIKAEVNWSIRRPNLSFRTNKKQKKVYCSAFLSFLTLLAKQFLELKRMRRTVLSTDLSKGEGYCQSRMREILCYLKILQTTSMF